MRYDPEKHTRMSGSITHDRFRERVDFVLELARHLHTSGTSVNRLEGAVDRVSSKLGLQVSIWSNPTGFIISFQDPVLGPPHTVTRVMRLKPGDTHLGRLSDADAIAEQLEPRLDALAAAAAMQALTPPQREVLQLLFGEDLSHAEAAQRLGWPLGTVKSHARRGLALLAMLSPAFLIHQSLA